MAELGLAELGLVELGRMELGSSRSDLHGRWLRRYGLRDAVSQWRGASAEKRPTLAFIAVASDGRIFRKVHSRVAYDLATQAERLAQDALASADTVEATRVAAQEVMGRVEAWRDEMEMASGRAAWMPPESAELPGRRGTPEPEELSDEALLKAALNRHPYYQEPIAQRLAALTIELGPTGLVRLGAPMDAVLAFGSVRFAAQSLRRRSRLEALDDNGVAAVLQAAGAWADETGTNPLMVDFEDRPEASLSQAIALAADSAACAAAAERLGLRSDVWEAAEEFHAYAVLSTHSRFVATMDYDKAQGFASAAARLAEMAIADPRVRLPRPPPGTEPQGPRMVLASARSVLRNGVLPRRKGTATSLATTVATGLATTAATSLATTVATGRATKVAIGQPASIMTWAKA